MSVGRKKDERSNIAYPWDEGSDVGSRIVCPKCGNDGNDGSISGKSGQWGIRRICTKCGHQWSGGIGVQRADFSEPPGVPGVARPAELDKPTSQFTGAPHRDPNKNYGRDDD